MELILGSANFIKPYSLKNKTKVDPIKILVEAQESKIRIIDTAVNYGDIHDLVFTNKFNFDIHSKIDSKDLSEKALKDSTKLIPKGYFDVLYIHDSESIKKDGTSLDPILKYKDIFYKKLGISLYELDIFFMALEKAEIEYIQIPINIFNMSFDQEMISIAKRRGKKIIVRSVFAKGLLTNKWRSIAGYEMKNSIKLLRLEEIARKHSVKISDLALIWIMGIHDISGIVLGFEDEYELRGAKEILNEDFSNYKSIFEEIQDIKINTFIDTRKLYSI